MIMLVTTEDNIKRLKNIFESLQAKSGDQEGASLEAKLLFDWEALVAENKRLEEQWEKATYARCLRHFAFTCTECTLATLQVNKNLEKALDRAIQKLAVGRDGIDYKDLVKEIRDIASGKE